MDLLLWRHAEAEEGTVDMERQLTKKGRKQAKTMADWIIRHAPRDLRVLVSPAIRCQQTALALGRPFETYFQLGPTATADQLIECAGCPTADDRVLIVGHQPTLGQLASRMLTGIEKNWSIQKGALWWLTRRSSKEKNSTLLRAAIAADLIS